MKLPGFLRLVDEAAYRQHFIDSLVRAEVRTRHGIRVHFKVIDFDHAFFESTRRNGIKDQFSEDRSQRMDWIIPTLIDRNADWYQGWVTPRRAHDVTRSAVVAFGDFVVVLKFGLRQDGELVGNFVTCYHADRSIRKIRRSPAWTREDCMSALREKGGP